MYHTNLCFFTPIKPMTSTYGKINNLKTSCHVGNSSLFDYMAVKTDNMSFGRINLAITDDNLAIASHNIAFRPFILALKQKSRSSSLKTSCHVSDHIRLFIFPNNLYRFFSEACIDRFVEFEFTANCSVFLIQFVLITDIADEHFPIWV